MAEGLDRAIGIVGAGHAGGALALSLREAGWRGPVALFGDEGVAPYQRPPLSKGWLKGTSAADDLVLRHPAGFSDQGIELRASSPIARADAATRSITFGDGTSRWFDVLVFATGARARVPHLPGIGLRGVFTLRTMADADRMRAECAAGVRLVVMGGGFIGLEVAAVMRQLGAAVTVVEQAPRLLCRSASAAIAAALQAIHESHGVRFMLGAKATAVLGREGRVCGVELPGGAVACDAVLAGVGAIPNDDLAVQAGLACADGVLVDSEAATGWPDVYAVGDCTRRPVPGRAEPMRLESVPSALEQVRRLTSALCGQALPPHEAPWFWSDQYSHKLQVAGIVAEGATLVERAGSGARRLVVHVGADGRAGAVEALDAPGDFLACRRAIGAGWRPDVARLADPAVALRDALT